MKDTNNKLDYNVWSGTEYNQGTYGFTIVRCTAESSKNWSSISESSLKITTNDSANWPYIDACRLTGLTGTITAELTVYAPKGYIRAVLFAANPNENIVITDVYQNDKPQKIVLSGDIPANYQYLTVRLFPRNDNVTYYVDDITFINK